VHSETSAVIGGTVSYTTSYTATTAAGTSGVTITPVTTLLTASNYSFSVVAGTITITQATPTITVTVGTYTYTGIGQGPIAITGNTGGGAVTWSYVGTGGTSYSASSTLPTNAGTYTATASVAANGNYGAASSAATPFTINVATPTIAVTVGTYTYTGIGQGPTAVTGNLGGGGVTWSYVGVSGTTYGPSATLPTNAGTYTATASVGANGNYGAAISSATSFTIGKAVLTITAGAQSVAYGTLATTVTGAGSYIPTGFVNSETSAVISGTVSYTTSYTATTAAGTSGVTITPVTTLLTASNYIFSVVAGTITITQATPTITVTVGTYTYTGIGQGPIAITGNTGGGAVTWSYVGTGGTSYSASSTLPTNAGSYTATASVAATSNYGAAVSSATPFTIGKAVLTITAGAQSVAYGTLAASVTGAGSYTPTGFVNSETSAVISGTVSYTTSYTATTAAGTSGVTITPVTTSLIASNYSFSAVAGTITITQATPTITVTVGSYTYTGTAQGPTAVTGNIGGGAVTWSYVGTGVTSYSASSTLPTNAGTYTATASVASTSNYGAAVSSVTAFTIGKAVLTITAGAQSVAYGTLATTVTGAGSNTPTGFVNSETSAVISGSVSYTTNYTASTAVGTSGIIITPDVSLLTASNYSFVGASGMITVTGTGGIWTGVTSTDYSTGSNWSDGNVPSSTDDITIPSSPTNQPILSASKSVGSINLIGTLSLNGHSFTVSGNVSGSGYLLGSTTSSLTVGGGTIYFDPSYNSLKDLTITGSTTLGNALNIRGVFTPTAGTFTTGGYLTLKSITETSTAVVGVVGGTVSGNVTVERYIANGLRTFRDLCPEVAGAGSVFTNWQEAGVNTNGYGTFISGISGYLPGVNAATGFDVSVTGAGSMQTYSAAGWAYPTSTKGLALNPYKGYRLLIRGNRAGSLFTTPQPTTMWSAATLRSTGSLVTGTVTYSTSGTSNGGNDSSYGLTSGSTAYSFLGNPYPCPIDWVTVSKTNLSPSYSYLDPTFNTTLPSGVTASAYVTYNADLHTKNNISSKINQYIQPGQAFWVQNTGTSPSLIIHESDKVPSVAAETDIFGSATLNRLSFGLYKNGSNIDGTVVVFRSDLTNQLSGTDSRKFTNGGENISIYNSGKNLSIKGTSLPTEADTLQLHLYGMVNSTNYQLQIDASIFNGNGYTPYIYDAFLNQRIMIDSAIRLINFTTTSDTASYNKRFSVGFIPTTLPVNSIVASASISNKIATINWNTVGEKGESYFEVEKSNDGKTFTSIGKLTAKNTPSASYASTDKNVTATVNYYRIKAVSSIGAISYSNVVRASVFEASSIVKVYPNPVRGTVFALQLGGLQTGAYSVDLYDVLGNKVYSKDFYNGTAEVVSINMGKHLATGNYTVKVTGNGQSYQTLMTVAE